MWKIEWKMRGGAVRTNPLDSSDSFLFFLSDARVKCAEPDRLRVYMGKCVKFAFFFLWMLFKFVFVPAGGCWSCFSWTVRLYIAHGSQITAGSTFSLFFRNQVITHTRKEIRNCRNIYRLDSLYDSILIIIFPTFCVCCVERLAKRCLLAAGRYTCTTHGCSIYIFALFFDILFFLLAHWQEVGSLVNK